MSLAATFASCLIVFIPSIVYSKYLRTCWRWQFGKVLWDGRTIYTSQLHSIWMTCKESGGSAIGMICPHVPRTAPDAGSFLCLQMFEVPKTRLYGRARWLFIYCHPLDLLGSP